MMSMTGYGRAIKSLDGRTMSIELKSVNHRFLDISIRMPRTLGFLEDTIRRMISEKLTRGHLDVIVSYQNLRSDAKTVRLDEALVQQYRCALERLNEILSIGQNSGLERIADFPDVLTVAEADEDEQALKELLQMTLHDALYELICMRAAEGERMQQALQIILKEIEEKSFLIDSRYPETVNEYAKRLKTRLSELIGEGFDPARIAQEVALMADKAAVDEETVRIRSHIQHARDMCLHNQPVGRSLDFLVQEMNREVNTISSKSQDLPITDACLSCKSAIEKLREQLQNIE